MFTRDEKDAIARYLALDLGPRSFWFSFLPYLLPPIAFAAFGLWRSDFLSMAVAFGVLLFLALWYLSYQSTTAINIRSALRKYEEVVRGLERPDV